MRQAPRGPGPRRSRDVESAYRIVPQGPGSGPRLQAPGSRLQGSGIRDQAPGPRSQAPGLRDQGSDPKRQAQGSGPGQGCSYTDDQMTIVISFDEDPTPHPV